MKKIIVFLVIFTIVQTACAELVEFDGNKYALNDYRGLKIQFNQYNDTLKILFIGSSYFNFNDLPGLFQELVNTAGKNISIDHYGKNGLFLSDHANNPGTESKINEQDWDYVILQGVGRNMAYPDNFTDYPVYPALVTLKEKIQKNCEQTKMVYCMPWAFEDGMTWYEDWTDTYEDMQLKIFDNTLNYSKEIGFTIAPVGWAWYTVLNEQDYPLHYLHMSDWNHPSMEGSYLMACVIFSTLYLEPSVSIPYYAGLIKNVANYFQTVASNTVLQNLSLWNIEPQNNNSPPCKPDKPSGPTSIRKNVYYTFTSSTVDVDGDILYYLFDWDDGTECLWIGPYESGALVEANHSWIENGQYNIRVKAMDVHGAESDWSDALEVSKQKECITHNLIQTILERIISSSLIKGTN